MNTQRVTISLPKYLYEELVQQVPTGKVSGFVSQAVERCLIEFDADPIKEFIELRKKFPRRKKADILKAIERGRE